MFQIMHLLINVRRFANTTLILEHFCSSGEKIGLLQREWLRGSSKFLASARPNVSKDSFDELRIFKKNLPDLDCFTAGGCKITALSPFNYPVTRSGASQNRDGRADYDAGQRQSR
jgi:hypothetical protein